MIARSLLSRRRTPKKVISASRPVGSSAAVEDVAGLTALGRGRVAVDRNERSAVPALVARDGRAETAEAADHGVVYGPTASTATASRASTAGARVRMIRSTVSSKRRNRNRSAAVYAP